MAGSPLEAIFAEVAQVAIRRSGFDAGSLGHVELVYMSECIPEGRQPRGKEEAVIWVAGFSMMYGKIAEIFKAGRIPTVSELEQTIQQVEESRELFQGYAKRGADCLMALQALISMARDDWEKGEFQRVYCKSEEWNTLLRCDIHDFDWTLIKARVAY
ncbi:hypothetical protein C8R43DRAFT_1122817 [Mycena crocata]|nr:hypothetical protein C8R43DRAFT_1122817 [Mycena crocata]